MLKMLTPFVLLKVLSPLNGAKSENPDEKEDAELGEQVEKDVEQHYKENAK